MLRHIPPAELSGVWWFVEAGLWKIKKKCSEPWVPLDVYRYVRSGQAGLYVCDDGFVVLRKLAEEFSREPYLHVWAMWFRPGKGKEKRSDLIAWLDRMREELSCAWIEYGSPRMGWIVMEPEFKRAGTIWRRT